MGGAARGAATERTVAQDCEGSAAAHCPEKEAVSASFACSGAEVRTGVGSE